MVIKISEKPIISMDIGKSLGTLKGLIYEGNQVTFLYCKFSNEYVYIPMTDVYIGPDAIMLKTTQNMNMLHTDAPTKVYTTEGAEVGTVTSIEMDDSFQITGIVVEEQFIAIHKVRHMENIIIVSLDQADTASTFISSTESVVSTEVDIASDHEDEERNETEDNSEEVDTDEQTDLINHKLNLETKVTSTERLHGEPTEDTEEITEEDIDSFETPEELTVEIDPRYNYLIGKKLLEDISILKETYEKDTPIDAPLIRFAIDNNAIVKVIMNTED